MVDETETARLRLCELAEVLGVPVDYFYQETPTARPEDTVELLRLWHRLNTSSGRLAALAAVNKILGEER
ncbi:hypothetical protein ACU4GR_03545 [Methylobacterium oryzae CBMB20]